jgi:predicted class III extradiol MEMO1 family dioxygenase
MTHSITKAKIGDIAHKTADNKQGYETMKDLPYDERKLKVVIETLFGDIEKLKKQLNSEIERVDKELFKVIEESKVNDIYELEVNKYGHIVGYKKISRDLIYVGELPKNIDNECYTVDMQLDEKKLEAINSLD